MGGNPIEIQILTMDSRTHTVRVDKSIPVPTLKQQIAQVTGVVPDQQRLICRGKVLKDEHNLSEYDVEDGHKLHLVVKPPVTNPSPVNHQNPATSSSSSVSENPATNRRVGIQSVINITIRREAAPVAPNSLTTLTNTIDRLRGEFAANVETLRTTNYDDNNNTPPGQNSNERGGVPTPEALASVLMNARGILTGEVSECLLQLARQLERHANVTDETERSWIQDNVLRSGNLLNYLGGTILELARTTLATQIGQEPAHGAVDSGPAHFISSTGPRPLTVSTNPNPILHSDNLGTFNILDDIDFGLSPALGSLVSGVFDQLRTSLSNVGNSQPVDSEPEPAAASEEGLFLSNMLQQLMPMISESNNGPENSNPDDGDQEPPSLRRDDDGDDPSVQPEAKRQRRD